jgi:hypothetical protein
MKYQPSAVHAALTLAIVLAAGALVTRAATDRQTTYVTFSGAVALPGVTLERGSYVFERVAAGTPDAVVVRGADHRKVYYMGTTQPSQRPVWLVHDRHIVFGERKADAPLPIAAWYPTGETFGYRFVYD